MSYATVDQCKSMFRCLDTTVTDPAVTDAEILEFIDETCASIDGCINELYSLPITAIDNPKSFLILTKLTKFKVAGILDDILNSYGDADKKPTWHKQGEQLLNKICPPKDPKTCKRCEPVMKLPDASFLGANPKGDTISVKATSGRVFSKGGNNW